MYLSDATASGVPGPARLYRTAELRELGRRPRNGESPAHGNARRHRRAKLSYYDRKDRGMAWLASAGAMTPVEWHGGPVIWAGLGYRLHSTLLPRNQSVPAAAAGAESPIRIEARSRTSREMRLLDAVALIEMLPDHREEFSRLPPPPRPHEGEFDGED